MASAPFARTVTSWFSLTASSISLTELLALTALPSLTSSTSDSKPLASLTNRVAGRACRPSCTLTMVERSMANTLFFLAPLTSLAAARCSSSGGDGDDRVCLQGGHERLGVDLRCADFARPLRLAGAIERDDHVAHFKHLAP